METQNYIDSCLKDMDSFFFGGNGWQAGLYQLVSDINSEQASWKPSDERNSIWKILMHINFWKYNIFAFTSGNDLSTEERQIGDWRNIPVNPTEELWQEELKLTKDTHEKLKALIVRSGSEIFNIENDDSNYIRENLNHDSYHAGQIGLLRVLQGIKPINY